MRTLATKWWGGRKGLCHSGRYGRAGSIAGRRRFPSRKHQHGFPISTSVVVAQKDRRLLRVRVVRCAGPTVARTKPDRGGSLSGAEAMLFGP